MKRFCLGMAAAVIFLSIVALQSGSKANASKKTELIVSAAVSLQNSLRELEADFEQHRKEIDLIFNFGSSGTLQQQIEQGASADIFLSAGKQQMDSLIGKKLVSKSKNVMSNQLVIVVRTDGVQQWPGAERLAGDDIRNIAIGQPDSVPAGMYAKQALTYSNLWDRLQEKLVYTKDVRQVLTYVETGNADAGFVYRTDALISNKVKVAMQLPSDSHEEIIYPAGLLAESKHPNEAQAFYDYLTSPSAMEIFRKHGFEQP
ncbi:molybdate ABC transporter substrate-binding protein [Cohnella kolymensis]